MAEEKPRSKRDELKVGPRIGPDACLFTRHLHDHQHQQVLGVMRPVREGESLNTGHVFTVTPKDPENGVYYVEDIHIPGAPSTGPAQVATDQYRTSWERTFGGNRQPRGVA